MSTTRKQTPKMVVMDLDQNFGTVNFTSDAKHIASIDIFEFTKTALSEFHRLGISPIVLVRDDLAKGYSAADLK